MSNFGQYFLPAVTFPATRPELSCRLPNRAITERLNEGSKLDQPFLYTKQPFVQQSLSERLRDTSNLLV
jgi:hypothetical protein